MATRNITTKIQMRRDTAANWESKNPILAAGEIAYDTTNKQTKIGDGTTAWNNLSCFMTMDFGFANASWSDIAKIAEAGTASKYFSVGDEKDITLTTGEVVTLVILGFNHDDKTAGGKAPITIGMKNCLATTYPMNSSNTNAGGWNSSIMRTNTMATLLSQLPSDLQAVIKQVNKKASAGSQGTTITTSADKLWLLAPAEICSKTAIENSAQTDFKTNAAVYTAEGEQYEFYKNLIGDTDPNTANADLIKYLSNGGGSAAWWWLRSPIVSYSNSFRVVLTNGIVISDYASNAHGVSFGFCI